MTKVCDMKPPLTYMQITGLLDGTAGIIPATASFIVCTQACSDLPSMHCFPQLQTGNTASASAPVGGRFHTIKIMKPAKIYWGPKDISKEPCPPCPLL